MTILDDKMLPGVKKILLKLGDTATLTESPDDTDYDATTGGVTFTPTAHTVLVTPPSPFADAYPKGDIGRMRETITILSKLLLAEMVPPVPDPERGWKLTIGTKVWQVLSVEDIKGAWQLSLE